MPIQGNENSRLTIYDRRTISCVSSALYGYNGLALELDACCDRVNTFFSSIKAPPRYCDIGSLLRVFWTAGQNFTKNTVDSVSRSHVLIYRLQHAVVGATMKKASLNAFLDTLNK